VCVVSSACMNLIRTYTHTPQPNQNTHPPTTTTDSDNDDDDDNDPYHHHHHHHQRPPLPLPLPPTVLHILPGRTTVSDLRRQILSQLRPRLLGALQGGKVGPARVESAAESRAVRFLREKGTGGGVVKEGEGVGGEGWVGGEGGVGGLAGMEEEEGEGKGGEGGVGGEEDGEEAVLRALAASWTLAVVGREEGVTPAHVLLVGLCFFFLGIVCCICMYICLCVCVCVCVWRCMCVGVCVLWWVEGGEGLSDAGAYDYVYMCAVSWYMPVVYCLFSSSVPPP
jgi:hypothetical protein